MKMRTTRELTFYPDINVELDMPTGAAFKVPAGATVFVMKEHPLTYRPLIKLGSDQRRTGYAWADYYALN